MKRFSQVACVTFSVGLIVGMFSSSAVVAESKSREVRPIQQWTGSIERYLQVEIPARGYIVSEKALTKLWNAWKITDEMPKVDFDKELVLVTKSQKGGYHGIKAEVDDQGNLTVMTIVSAHLSFDCCKYLIALIKRDGIKTINGKVIEEE
jgi:hypothetical protein